jgi:hypothetical protein
MKQPIFFTTQSSTFANNNLKLKIGEKKETKMWRKEREKKHSMHSITTLDLKVQI